MSGYHILRPALLAIEAEYSHRLAMGLLGTVSKSHLLSGLQQNLWYDRVPKLPTTLFGRQFDNPLGLAAGLDKDCISMPALARFGFGFIELGTVTPEPQPGNSGKRIFRIASDQAVINRLGFNSVGLQVFESNLKTLHSRKPKSTILGINIGKNSTTPNEKAFEDYVRGLECVYDFADYIVINVSSPNTPGLRGLQGSTLLDELLEAIFNKRKQLIQNKDGRTVPITLKVSPDLQNNEIHSLVESSMKHGIAAIIATNTTITRPASGNHKNYAEQGGLSGKPLHKLSIQTIRAISEASNHEMPIIGVGGISSADDAWQQLLAGASLVQIYTALIFEGPTIVRQIIQGLAEKTKQYDCKDLNVALNRARSETEFGKL